LLILTDDLGWQDVKCYDIDEPSPFETPNIDKLAKEGVLFWQAYSPATTCSPSRGAILSGKHPVRLDRTAVRGGHPPMPYNQRSPFISPWQKGALDASEVTIAESLQANGYKTGHSGKWHVGVARTDVPLPKQQGFDFSKHGFGAHRRMKDRTTEFATTDASDKFRLDDEGFPFDDITQDGIDFMKENKEDPFFLFYCPRLVHTPIQTRSEALLRKYYEKLGIEVPTADTDITTGGHTNPYYGAMVGTLDWSLGKVVDYLKATDDPRNPGKKLFETTYIIFSSDNGASENDKDEIVTDNYPLDLGKTSAKEGGIRVPLVITGPDIPVNVFDNIVNGLDFYPTILSLTGTKIADNIFNDLDGADLSPLLKGKSTTVKDNNGTERTDLFWHYPNADDEKAKSAIRSGNYKLYKKYIDGSYEAYQLYNDDGSFNDIEEAKNVISSMPKSEKDELIAKLEAFLKDNNAKFPTWNPDYSEDDGPLPNQDAVPAVSSVSYDQNTNVATAVIENTSGKAAINTATLLYKEEEGGKKQEWFESSATTTTIKGNTITADVPKNAIAVVFNMIDENNFLVLSEEVAINSANKKNGKKNGKKNVVASPKKAAVTSSATQITLNNDAEQSFNTATNYAELIGKTKKNRKNRFLQTRTEGDGNGAKFMVKSTKNTTVVCDKVTFNIRAQAGDVVAFDVTIAGKTQSFTYASVSSKAHMDFSFDTPVTFTNTSQEIVIIITSLTNSDGEKPRFRIYNLSFHLEKP